MQELSKALARAKAIQNAKQPRKQHPDGWEPGVRWDESNRTGAITVSSAKPSPDWDSLLAEWGFDPGKFRVVDDSIQFRTWDAATGEGNVQRFYYYRAQIGLRQVESDADLQKLIALIGKRKPKVITPAKSGSQLCVALADWQIGQRGTEESVQKIMRLVDEIPARYRELTKMGVKLKGITILGLGDLVDGCDGWYPAQTFQSELNEREQRTLVRRLLVKIVESCADVAPTLVAVVGGNHGEARRNGKSYTDASDNGDVEVAEQAAEVFAANPEYRDRVSFVIPREELAISLDIDGTIVAITHGHLAKRGVGAANKLENWWRGQALGMRAAGEGTILVSGHYHHLLVNSIGPRTHIQAPGMCGPSAWYSDITGIGDSAAGTLSVVIGDGGWDHLRVLAR